MSDPRMRVKKLLHDSLSVLRPPRPVTLIHASEVTKDDFCPRQHVLTGMLKRTAPAEKINCSLSYTFAEGYQKQHALGDDWLKDSMFGTWECLGCLDKTPPQRRPECCVVCNGTRFHYEEMNFTHAASGAKGGIDAMLQIKNEKLLIVESKIMTKEEFKELEAPKAEHRVRTSLYLGIVAGSNDPLRHAINTEYASIIYMMRGYGYKQGDVFGMSPFKEFIVERDDASNMKYLSRGQAVKLSRLSIKEFREKEPESVLYPHGICNDMFCKRASNCMVSKDCFSGKYSASITWVDKHGVQQHESDDYLLITTGTDLLQPEEQGEED